MLDTEPTGDGTTAATTDQTPPAPRTRRRAATRPAGPPASPADGTESIDAPAAPAPTRKRAAAKKAAAAPAGTEPLADAAPGDGLPVAAAKATKRAPAKRTAKRAAASAEAPSATPLPSDAPPADALAGADAPTDAPADTPRDVPAGAEASQEPAAAPAKKAAKRAARTARRKPGDVVETPVDEPAATAAAPDATTPAAAAPDAAAPGDVAGTDEPAPATPPTPRKRTRARAAAPVSPFVAPATPEPAAEVASDADDEAADAEAADAEAAEDSAPAPGSPVAVPPVTFAPPVVLFQPPVADEAETPPAPSRRRRARKGVAEPEPADATAPETAPSDPADAPVAEPERSDDDADADEESGGRRRRRRGGRGRRARTASDDERTEDDAPAAGTTTAASGEDEAPDGAAAADTLEEAEAEGDDDAGGSRRRRRRRRRGGAGDAAGADDPEVTVVHVREPRRSERSRDDEVTGLKGSTRLEAKKLRRREGREQGRRRTPLITEAEFLARREAVERVMVVRQRGDRTQIGVLEDGVLVEHYVNRTASLSMAGNVYLGKVQNVLPSMEAAFVDIGRGRNAVLYAGEVNWDAAGLEGQPRRIEVALKSGDPVLVQVTKDPMGHKGARLTSQVSLAGRFLVYVPDGSMTGISRKLPDTERARLKSVLKQVVPESAGVIVRTAAEGASEEELRRDVARLQAQWEDIERKATTASAPALLYGEPDLTTRVVRDLFNEDFSKLVVSGDEAFETVQSYLDHVAPDLAARLSRWTSEQDVFAAHRVDEQLAKALDRKVWLPSGGSLVIDRTEAMVVIDVNTGKFTGKGGNLEETVTKNNLEAAEEIVRQLRLRDLGGIIVVDFIDMVLESNRDLVLRRLLECLGRDRTKHQVAEVTSLGLVQMTRKRVGQGLLEAFSETCETCNGRGIKVSMEPVESSEPGDASGADRGRSKREGRAKGGASKDDAATPDGRADGGRADGGRSDGSRSDGSRSDGSRSDGSRSDAAVAEQRKRQQALAVVAAATLRRDEAADGRAEGASVEPAAVGDGSIPDGPPEPLALEDPVVSATSAPSADPVAIEDPVEPAAAVGDSADSPDGQQPRRRRGRRSASRPVTSVGES